MIDETVIAAARQSDKSAITQLCAFYYQAVYLYMYYQVRTAQDAEDLTHEVFVRMVKNVSGQHGHFEAWLFMIAKNVSIDFKRKHRKDEKMIEEFFHHTSDPQEGRYHDEHDLGGQIKKLPDEQKDVIVFKFFNGMTNKQIADILGKTEGAIKALQFRAIKSLKTLCGEGLS